MTRMWICSLVLFAGCAGIGTHPYAPKPLIDETAVVESLQWRYLGDDWWEDYQMLPTDEQFTARNEYLWALIILADISFQRFEHATLFGISATESAFDIAVLGLTSAATLASGSATKSILAAIATGLTGSKLAVSQHMLADRSIGVLLLQMRALRAQQLTVLMDAMARPVEAYTLLQGLRDVLVYVNAGSLTSALQSVAGEAAMTMQREQSLQKARW